MINFNSVIEYEITRIYINKMCNIIMFDINHSNKNSKTIISKVRSIILTNQLINQSTDLLGVIL